MNQKLLLCPSLGTIVSNNVVPAIKTEGSSLVFRAMAAENKALGIGTIAGQERIPPTLIRLSVGCEHVEDLWVDLDTALRSTVPR